MSDPIEWEEYEEAFLGKYFPRERRKVKVEEFIILNQGDMRVEEYSLKLSMLHDDMTLARLMVYAK